MPSLNYVSVISLDCVAIGKRFNNWTRTLAAKYFLQKQSILLNVAERGKYDSGCLIEYERGGNIWIHPSLAIEYQSFLEKRYKISDWLYVIHMKGTSFYKIGVTRDVNKRLLQLQAGNPVRLSVVLRTKCNNAKKTEVLVHSKLQKYSVHGEWFEVDFDKIVTTIKGE
jgi:hypothetical protein